MFKHFHKSMALLVVFSLCALASGDDPGHGSAAPPLKDLLSEDVRTVDRAVDVILNDRKKTIEQLIPMIDPANSKKYSDFTRCAAAYLLGELRAEEAVPVLSKALANQPGRKTIDTISRYDGPVSSALFKIGRPAIPAMIENIKSSDNEDLRRDSALILEYFVGGKPRLLQLLDKLDAKTGPAEQRVSRRIRDTKAWAESNITEAEEPLY